MYCGSANSLGGVGIAATCGFPSLPASSARRIDLTNKPWRGDFDAMLERRMIRVLVPFNRTLYFNDRGHERGLTADFVRDFDRFVNRTYADRVAQDLRGPRALSATDRYHLSAALSAAKTCSSD